MTGPRPLIGDGRDPFGPARAWSSLGWLDDAVRRLALEIEADDQLLGVSMNVESPDGTIRAYAITTATGEIQSAIITDPVAMVTAFDESTVQVPEDGSGAA